MQVAFRYQHKYTYVSKHSFHTEALIDKFCLDKYQQVTNHGIILTQQRHIRNYVHTRAQQVQTTGIRVFYRYNKTVKVWLFRGTGNNYSLLPMFISLDCASRNKPWLRAIGTPYISHNHTLTV